jgi:hypothetical protein
MAIAANAMKALSMAPIFSRFLMDFLLSAAPGGEVRM